MDWQANHADWPLAAFSRFVLHKPHHWHIQEDGDGPLLLLIHGAGGATQSWRHLFPLLARSHHVVAIDLPGQGFTKLGAQQRCGLDPMAEDIAALCHAEGWQPAAIIGHSAGTAIALRLAEMMHPRQPKVIGINAALDNFNGLAGVMFPIIAKTLALLPMVADIFSASSARGNTVQRLIDGTGSTLTLPEMEFYRRLITDRGHVSATLQMMSQWKLDPLLSRLPDMEIETLLLAADGDLTVSPDVSRRASERMPRCEFTKLERLGHLAHEEDASAIAAEIEHFLARTIL